MSEAESVIDCLFSIFVDHIEKISGGEIVDMGLLKSLFINELPNIVISHLDENVNSHLMIDELYGDEILECIEFPQDGNEYDDEA